MRIPQFVVGVDGGGTKTVALVATTEGKILSRGESGSSNYNNVGQLAAAEAIRQAVEKATSRAGLCGRKAEIAVVALAAVTSKRDRAIAESFVRRSGIARRSIVIHDSKAALYIATGGGQGIVVIAGTGCVAAGINRKGEYERASGWGYLIDDVGSAYDIGRKALMSAFRAIDGRAADTKLVSVLKRKFRVNSLEDALAVIYSKEFTVEKVARLAVDVAKVARYDRVSRQILSRAGIALAEAASTVATRLRMRNERFTVALVGGVYKAGSYVVNPFKKRLKQECPFAEVHVLKVDPAKGALQLAVETHRHSGQ